MLTYVRVIANRRFKLQNCQIVLESRCIILSMNDDPLNVLRHGTLRLEITRYIILSEHGNQRRQKSRLTMRCVHVRAGLMSGGGETRELLSEKV